MKLEDFQLGFIFARFFNCGQQTNELHQKMWSSGIMTFLFKFKKVIQLKTAGLWMCKSFFDVAGLGATILILFLQPTESSAASHIQKDNPNIKSMIQNMNGDSSPNAAVGRLCYISKNSKLAMDQRDEARTECLKKKKSEMNVSICLNLANSMEYSTNAEEARQICLYELGKPITIRDCLKISKAMEYPDSGDDVRWECMRQFRKTLTEKQCLYFANSMDYPAHHQRAQIFCSEELK
jgi:hypothetical protein